MPIILKHDYLKGLRESKPITIKKNTVRPGKGSLGAITNIPQQTIPPLNTDIRFNVLPSFNVKQKGLGALNQQQIPENFNWRDNAGGKKDLISKPGNQMLCGSCWAISAAGIIADNFVVSNLVDWKPELSTTWCLSSYPQGQCNGGNPALLLSDISDGGISDNHCVDYSWCATEGACNGTATKHFTAGKNISSLIPSSGCYYSDTHHLYFIDRDPKSVYIGSPGVDKNNFGLIVKNHLLSNGPVLAGFTVFDNFMSGAFTKINGGVYLEDAIYDNGQLHFEPGRSGGDNASEHFKGSHAVAIIGWGIQKDVVIDDSGKKENVPYWFCRNSWTERWGDGGYFKMAMYPYNKVAQFDARVSVIDSGNVEHVNGGVILISVSKPPELININQNNASDSKKIKTEDYYKSYLRGKSGNNPIDKTDITPGGGDENKHKKMFKFFILLLILFFIIFIYMKLNKS